MMMKTVYDVQQLLKRFGTIIYTGNPLGDLELIQDEVRELYNQRMIDVNDFKQAIIIIRAAVNKLQ
ncbi:YqgQ family protein [Bacillus sp. NEB1478]|nr:YqgQ family protein [Bacillus sp. NEB1478]WNB93545.1 YqgQ family protein [Bacillus sp. NEB1478]